VTESPSQLSYGPLPPLPFASVLRLRFDFAELVRLAEMSLAQSGLAAFEALQAALSTHTFTILQRASLWFSWDGTVPEFL